MKRRTAVALSACAVVAVVVGAAVWVSHWEFNSPRFDAMEPHIRLGATRAEFEQEARQQRVALEYEDLPGGWVGAVMPLDGSLRGKQLQLRFDTSGELQWAAIISQSGKIERFLFSVRK